MSLHWNVYEMFKGRRLAEFQTRIDAFAYARAHADEVPDDAGTVAIGGEREKLPLVVEDLDELDESLTIHRAHPRSTSVSVAPFSETMVAPQNMATATKPKSKPVVEKKIGRPKSGYAERYYLRHHQEEIDAWRIAAATTGKSLHQWMLEALNGEAKKATHVPMVKRGR